jgi:hypothetical protein
MLFASDKQRKYLYANKPEVAKKFSDHEKRMNKQRSKAKYLRK